MKNASKIKWRNTFFLLFGLVFLVQAGSAFTVPEKTVQPIEVSCEVPSVSITGRSAGYVSFSWGAVSGTTGYTVYYVRKNDNYTSSPFTTSSTSISFSSLPSGTYDFYFSSNCGSEESEYVIEADLIM